MLLLIDVGNTNSVFGLATPDCGEITSTLRLSSSRERTADEWFALLDPHLQRNGIDTRRIEGMIVSSVVPAITTSLVDFGRRLLSVEPMVVGIQLDLGISIAVDAPAEVGTDRLVNAAMAYATFGGPSIVVDLGTATKIEAVTEAGTFLGGVIAPGIGLSLDALAGRAARLYAVELRPPQRAIGTNTVAAVQSGVVTGHLAMIEGMVARVAAELGSPRHVVLTGGYSGILAGTSPVFTDYVPDLTMRGLRYLYLRNRPAA